MTRQVAVLMLLISLFSLAFSDWMSTTAKINTTWTGSSYKHTGSQGMENFLSAIKSNVTISCGFLCKDYQSCLFSVFVFFPRPEMSISEWDFSPRVLWSANRHKLVQRNATVELGVDGNLKLLDADGSYVWSTGTDNQGVVQVSLQSSSNLLLLDSSNRIVWQSFDHPTDVLVPEQNFSDKMQLIAAKDEDSYSYSEGIYRMELQKNELVLYAAGSPQQPYWTSMVNSTKKLFFFSVYPQLFEYLKLQSNGNIQVHSVSENDWAVRRDLYRQLGTSCVGAAACGTYGLCIDGRCQCPETSSVVGSLLGDSFSQIDSSKPELGCKPRIPLTNVTEQHMIQMENITYFAAHFAIMRSTENITALECEMNCLGNSSCNLSVYIGQDYPHCYSFDRVYTLERPSIGLLSTVFIKMQNGQHLLPSLVSHQRSSNPRNLWVLLVSVCGSLLVIFFIAVVCLIIRRRLLKKNGIPSNLESLPSLPKQFSYRQLQVCTENFNRVLGKGGFGTVYYGEISSGLSVAVKRLEYAKQGETQFEAEVRTIGSIHHLNLVKLQGFCVEGEHRLLVYEFMPNGSLDHWIFSSNNKLLEWDTRFKISIGIAKGLAYLHDECHERIVHLDIKPQNILLDNQLLAKVSDFGLSKLMNRDESAIMTAMRGTPGYLAPEWLHSRVTEKADVYSFGILLLEIVSGRRCIDYECADKTKSYLPAWINRHIRKGSVNFVEVIDGRLKGEFDSEQAKRAVIVGLWCIQNDAKLRPSMSSVVDMLKGTGNVANPPAVHSNTLSSAFCEFVESLSV